MKAVVYSQYGGPEVLHVSEVNKPVPGDTEVLIRIHAVSVNFGDLMARNIRHIRPREFNMPWLFLMLARLTLGIRKPKNPVLGNSFSGRVESAGKNVSGFRAGDCVYGHTEEKMGACAEYLCMPEKDILSRMPKNVTFEEAAVMPYGGVMANRLLQKAHIQTGQKVLVLGASGGIGAAAVQLASHHYGAVVTGVCGTERMDFVKTMGAAHVISYEKEDVTRLPETYDLVIDILGKASFTTIRKILSPGGIYLAASFKLRKILQMLFTSLWGKKKALCVLAVPDKSDLEFIRPLAEKGRFRSVIDRCFPMEQAAEAHAFLEGGMRKANVVIAMQ